MKNKWVLLLLFLVPACAQQWKMALPGYQYRFPRDHFSHPGFQGEWWYYTGNLRAPNGRRFGFELTFFRFGIHLPEQAADRITVTWRPDEVYLAHLALSDIDGHEFYHTERMNRAGPGLAGASLDQLGCWNGNWRVRWTSLTAETQHLEAVSDRFTLTLNLRPAKPFVINGRNGVSQKGPQPGEASHYITFTRLLATGELRRHDSPFQLSGLAWMDHEYFTEAPHGSVTGWDWFAMQLNNNEELMIYRLRQKSGQPDPYSSGTYVNAAGWAQFLEASQFSLSPGGEWRSPSSGARYPLEWKISVPSLGLELTEKTALTNQELFTNGSTAPTYWEGAVTYSGMMRSQPVNGVGYLELTGYRKEVSLSGGISQSSVH
ncbi:MAG: hypothetical protein JOZ62_00050 [Acidobacteriaceae bacterium]|nr:hypothetical protein [Acidobacteriaceae bacterium]